jgi:phosphatidylserine decarboxylase
MGLLTRAWLQHLLPKALLSRSIYRLARSKRPLVKNALIGWFARTYGIDMSEAEPSQLAAYPTLNAFFTRALKAGMRPIAGDEHTIVAPADGFLSEFGVITAGQLLQAKGMRYRLDELVAEDGAALTSFEGGSFLTIYLAPPNYHRVHTPIAGALTRTTYVPGDRFSVSLVTAAAIGRLFCRNERVICWLDSPAGEVAVVLVGALNVSSISTVNLGEITSGAARRWREPAPLPLVRGAELGRFNLGSTVVLLFGRDAVRWDAALTTGAKVRMGEPLGRLSTGGSGTPAARESP